MRRIAWYRIIFASILLIPAVVCQTVVPIVPFSVWEETSESVYAALLRFQKPKTSQPSQVVLIEIDDQTLETYGWPVDRSYYAQLLERLKASGHPWVLSMLQFQAQANVKGTVADQRTRERQDEQLARSIKAYGRFIGSGLRIEPGAELSTYQEESLLPGVILSRSGKPPEALPYLPMTIAEDERFVEAQRAFGFGTHFGTQATIRCMPFYISDINHTGQLVIPSSLVWAAAHTAHARIQTASGATWPRPGEKLPHSFKRQLHIAYKHCLTSPSLTTREFMAQRKLHTISFADALSKTASADLAGKVVILARSDMRKFRGPGSSGQTDEHIVPEHVLAARFLDGILSGETIRREDLSRKRSMAWLPLALAALFSLVSLALPVAGVCIISLLLLAALLGFSAVSLVAGVYLVPMQAMSSTAATALGLGALYAYLRYYGIRRQMRFTERLREKLSQCNTLAEIEARARTCAQDEFESVQLVFDDYDRRLYQASSDPNAALALIDNEPPALDAAALGPGPDSIITKIGRPPRQKGLVFGSVGISIAIAINSELGRLGTIKLTLAYKSHEQDFMGKLIDILRVETSQHWHRIKLLVDQKLLDYRFLMEQTRGDIMERFLTQVIVAKFSDSKTMMENLTTVLTPKPTRAALMQADIRGYSKVSAKMAPLDMVKLLQGYYRNVVDAAQMVAQVKLIGDCIFLFIEEAAATADSSPVDLAVELAAILVAETDRQNAIRAQQQEEPLHFGIAIHYGDVVAGNLSSDSCIDYTVIGPHVNFVARLEELTKDAAIGNCIGANGTLLSTEASQALIKHHGLELIGIDLEAMNLQVRSFPDVTKVLGLQASATKSIEPGESLSTKAAS